ncbi:MAG: NADH:flavin oxidoreductase [Gammaproteobacteria bacterium]|nr:NADH:flavin oxidoreductase [Gammaproteobacteria bacterium]
MWKPPQRIKYIARPGSWPDAEEARRSRLFSPLSFGALRLATRSWVPAMVPWRATQDGYVNDDVLEWYARFARGRPGALVIEATGIRDIPSGPLLRIGDDRFLPGLRHLAETVHRESHGETRLLIQLIDFLTIRRRPPREKFLRRFLKIDRALRDRLDAGHTPEEVIRERLCAMSDAQLEQVLDAREFESLQMGYRERVSDMHLEHVRKLPQVLPGLFAQAAARAREAGIDGVELHYAHAYTMASFLSAHNDRADGYGQTRDNRLRLPLEVYDSVRQRVGRDYPVGCRLLAEECIDGGSAVADACHYATAFARAGMDFVSLSRGGKFEDAMQPKPGEAAYPYTGPSGYECMPQYISDEQGPFGRNLEPAREIRTAVRAAGYETPIVTAGGVHGFRMAEAMLHDGQADIVGAARQSLADPDWFLKMRLGLGAQVRVCEYTNYCEGLDRKHKQVTCQLWDRSELDEPDVRRSADGRRRLTAPDWHPPG